MAGSPFIHTSVHLISSDINAALVASWQRVVVDWGMNATLELIFLSILDARDTFRGDCLSAFRLRYGLGALRCRP